MHENQIQAQKISARLPSGQSVLHVHRTERPSNRPCVLKRKDPRRIDGNSNGHTEDEYGLPGPKVA